MTRWYVVQTHPHSEQLARRHLLRQGFVVFLPEYLRRRSHARRIDMVGASLFPGYLFVAMNVEETRWRAISSTSGVRRLICNGTDPVPLPPGIVEDIQSRLDDNGFVQVRPVIPFRPGEAVQVMDGPLADQVGFFECATDEERVILLLNILGREIRVKVPLASVAHCA